MAKNHDDEFNCPLFKRKILYGECYEVQEIRESEMDMELAIETFDVEMANKICQECQWYMIKD